MATENKNEDCVMTHDELVDWFRYEMEDCFPYEDYVESKDCDMDTIVKYCLSGLWNMAHGVEDDTI